MSQDELQSDSNSLDVLLSLADLYVQNGLVKEAKGLLKTAIEQNRDAVEPYLSLSKIYLEEGDRQKAIEILKKAEDINPENQNIVELLWSIDVVGEAEEVPEAEEAPIVEEITEGEVTIKSSIARELGKLLKIEGIAGAILVDDVGSLIQAELDLPLDEESTGAIINTIYNRIKETTKELELGGIRRVLFELPGGSIFMLGTPSIRFIVLTKRNIRFASLEGKIKEVFERIRTILGVD